MSYTQKKFVLYDANPPKDLSEPQCVQLALVPCAELFGRTKCNLVGRSVIFHG